MFVGDVVRWEVVMTHTRNTHLNRLGPAQADKVFRASFTVLLFF